MFIRDLTTPECHDVLQKATIGRLACARENQPYVVPIHVYFDGDCLYSFAMLGQKIAWMRENPRVCVQVDDIVDRFNWATVVVFGRYEELLSMPSDADARRNAHELFRRVPEWWQPGASTAEPQTIRMAMVYRIQIDSLSGRLAERREKRAGERPWWLDLVTQSAGDREI
jgi:nitroimidazol reductase NimA-like FMN-containing flavoprotein (pyridoxamine 5'-phosphate oxidase superfamily)